jgi:hypothetical protein
MRINPSVLLAVFLIFLSGPARAAGAAVGRFDGVTGTATLFRSTGEKPLTAKAGDPVYLNDRIETGAAAHLTLHFIDDTEIILGPNGKLAVDEYVYDPAAPAHNKARYKILDAAFSFLDGKIAKVKNPDVKIDLNFGSIGIRGTRLLRGMRDHKCLIYLQAGSITVSNNGGSVPLKPGQMTQMDARSRAPRSAQGWKDGDIGWVTSQLGF